MCGIAGLVSNQLQTDLLARVTKMAGAMAHRGPDDEGFYVKGKVGLANRRLAIRDLSPAGHMPMPNANQDIWITYNGEIYNAEPLRAELEKLGFIFRSNSDTEVILYGYQAWGIEIANKLRGMFAFAIVDEPAQKLYIARDHLGIKPVYYAITEQAFVFASELKTVLSSGVVSGALNPAGISGYLQLGSVPNPLTIYQEIKALEPATHLWLNLDQPTQIHKACYWQLPVDEEPNISYETAVAEVHDLLAEAVKIRLVSDVPLGAFLSGGLDSSCVVALMRQATNGPIRTCSMAFEEATYSEAHFAKAMAERAATEHYERVITAGEMKAEFGAVLSALDQPSVDGVNTYFVSQTARQAGLTVSLSGLGGDELFGGYPNTFGGVPQMYRALRMAQKFPAGDFLARGMLHLMPGRNKWNRVYDALAQPASMPVAYLTRRGLFSSSELGRLLQPDFQQKAHFNAIEHIATLAPFAESTFSWISRSELRTYTHHQLLRDTDAMSMAHSLEVRVPLLDKKLVEKVLRLPAAIKTNHLPGPKPLLNAAIGPLLPDVIRQRQDKQGFTFPFAIWLKGILKPQVEAQIERLASQSWINPAGVRQIQQQFMADQIHWSRLWSLVALSAFV